MDLKNSPYFQLWGRPMLAAFILFTAGSIAIFAIHDQFTHVKELFYCWLLVFFNAYIGIFIANQAINRDFTGFMVWGFLINGIRNGAFLILLLVIVKHELINDRGFVLLTFFGYFSFLAAEIIGLQKHTLKRSREVSAKIDD